MKGGGKKKDVDSTALSLTDIASLFLLSHQRLPKRFTSRVVWEYANIISRAFHKNRLSPISSLAGQLIHRYRQSIVS